jgi:chemotaxis response regulator CheB
MNKILLVDDDRELTSLLKELLDMEGFNVLVAHDGEQALALLDDSIDLLLLDVMMPKKNGIDTLKELRQTHQTPVIMLTARGSGWIAFSALSWARMTICLSRSTIVNWWRVFARFCAVPTGASSSRRQQVHRRWKWMPEASIRAVRKPASMARRWN